MGQYTLYPKDGLSQDRLAGAWRRVQGIVRSDGGTVVQQDGKFVVNAEPDKYLKIFGELQDMRNIFREIPIQPDSVQLAR